MKQGFIETFKESRHQPADTLSENIWQAILQKKKQERNLKIWAYSLAGIFSFSALFPVAGQLSNQITESGFYEYFSLVFSDTASVVSYWRELTLSLVDSLPTTTLIASLALLFVLLFSIRNLAYQYKNPLQLA